MANGTTQVIAAAGAAADTVDVTVAQVATSVVVSADSAILGAGDTLEVTVAASDANGFAIAGAAPVWMSADTAVLRVVDGGVTGRFAGTTTLTAAVAGGEGALVLEVVPGAAVTLEIDQAVTTLDAIDAQAQRSAAAMDAFGNSVPVQVTWSTRADTSAVVNETGLVTAVGNGTTELVATAGALADTALVEVQQVIASVQVANGAASFPLPVGDVGDLLPVAMDANGHAIDGVAFSWATADPLTAEPRAENQVLAVAPGQVEVTGSADGHSDGVIVDVSGFRLAISEFAAEFDGNQIFVHRGDDRNQAATILGTDTVTAQHETHEEPAWSPDGQKLAYVTQGNLYISDGVPGPDRDTIIFSFDTVDVSSPAWSPAGEHIAFARSGQIMIVELATGEISNLTSGVWVHSGSIKGHPTWSPDGSMIAFEVDAGDYIEIWAVRLDAAMTAVDHFQLLDGAAHGVSARSPVWSPLGDRIAFAASPDAGSQGIWVVDAGGGIPEALSDPGDFSQDVNPTWSPNGQRIAFERCSDGCFIWVMEADGSSEWHVLTPDNFGNAHPAWGRAVPPEQTF